MDDMIERVARAMYDTNTPSKHCVPFEGLHPLSQKKFRLRARAAIEAMREPNGRMLFAGYCALSAEWPKDWHAGGTTPEAYSAQLAYRAMIDAILKDGD